MCFTLEIWISGVRVTSSLLNSPQSLLYTTFLLPNLHYDFTSPVDTSHRKLFELVFLLLLRVSVGATPAVSVIEWVG